MYNFTILSKSETIPVFMLPKNGEGPAGMGERVYSFLKAGAKDRSNNGNGKKTDLPKEVFTNGGNTKWELVDESGVYKALQMSSLLNDYKEVDEAEYNAYAETFEASEKKKKDEQQKAVEKLHTKAKKIHDDAMAKVEKDEASQKELLIAADYRMAVSEAAS